MASDGGDMQREERSFVAGGGQMGMAFLESSQSLLSHISTCTHERPSNLTPRYKFIHQPIRRHGWEYLLQHFCSGREQGPAWGPLLGKCASKMWWTHEGIMASKYVPILTLETCQLVYIAKGTLQM